MHGIDFGGGGGGGRVPYPVPSENLLICCNEIMTYNETYNGSYQIILKFLDWKCITLGRKTSSK